MSNIWDKTRGKGVKVIPTIEILKTLNVPMKNCDGCSKEFTDAEIVLSDGILGEFCRKCSNHIERAEKKAIRELRLKSRGKRV